jgi:hypothetical protein
MDILLLDVAVVDDSLDLAMGGVKMQYPLYGLTVSGGLTFICTQSFFRLRVFFTQYMSFEHQEMGRPLHRGRK